MHIDEIPHLKYVIANIKSDPNLKTYKDTFRLIDKNGELQFIKTEFVIKHNKKYELLRINGFIQDVTADKLKLAVNNEISVQSTCSDKQAVIILDANGFVLGSNLEVLDILGYTQEELIDMSISKIYEHPEFLTDELDLYSKKIKETSRFENDGYYLKKDGSKFQANVVVTTLQTRHGSLYGFMMVIRSRIYGIEK